VAEGRRNSIKDSFADLDLTPAGFEILFRAGWLSRRPADSQSLPAGWSVVGSPAELDSWQSAWNEATLFPAALLAAPDVAVLLRKDSLAGAVANRSAQVTGLSNVFAHDDDLASAWAEAAEAAQAHWGPRPLVGYASGEGLAAAQQAGFVTIGELAVWLRS
jgi:hypothetical protein